MVLILSLYKYKGMALLIRSFLETAVNPQFIRNHYHNALFRWHILGDTNLSKQRDSPYYSNEFFMAIKVVVQEGLMNVASMTTKQWYRTLLENNVTMKQADNNQRVLIPIKTEIRYPNVNWDRS